jgi:hypothetical protein
MLSLEVNIPVYISRWVHDVGVQSLVLLDRDAVHEGGRELKL